MNNSSTDVVQVPSELFNAMRLYFESHATASDECASFLVKLNAVRDTQSAYNAEASVPIQAGVHKDSNNVTTYSGMLSLHSHGDADDILFLSSLSDPLAKVLQSDISYKNVTVRYWITDKPANKADAQESFIRRLMGAAKCDFGSRYSELTGYLWTDEEVKIGGHDLISELRSHVGKWLILEVEIHKNAKK